MRTTSRTMNADTAFAQLGLRKLMCWAPRPVLPMLPMLPMVIRHHPRVKREDVSVVSTQNHHQRGLLLGLHKSDPVVESESSESSDGNGTNSERPYRSACQPRVRLPFSFFIASLTSVHHLPLDLWHKISFPPSAPFSNTFYINIPPVCLAQ
jgi:hypothetical protein